MCWEKRRLADSTDEQVIIASAVRRQMEDNRSRTCRVTMNNDMAFITAELYIYITRRLHQRRKKFK